MYPAAREVLDDGDEIADHEIEEHGEAEQMMKDLEGLDPDDEHFDVLLTKLIKGVRHHIKDEEDNLLPRFKDSCSEGRLRALGEKVSRAKEMAPTRPHPKAPDTPPANRILGPGVALVDRMRDALKPVEE